MESLLNIIMEEPGQLIELSGLASEMKTPRQTLFNYLKYLEESFLLRKLYNCPASKRKIKRKLKKFYPTIISTDLVFSDDSTSKSTAFEGTIANQLKAGFFW
ncbi:MAG: hypothetical protein ACP5PX_02430 [Candidatus Hadarchaeum sp.]|uniref:hypothetical protein n=1 Tax=Candidatus Hadarchaeum sp. TaxID=2883567 RepID=UPI003D0FEBE0